MPGLWLSIPRRKGSTSPGFLHDRRSRAILCRSHHGNAGPDCVFCTQRIVLRALPARHLLASHPAAFLLSGAVRNAEESARKSLLEVVATIAKKRRLRTALLTVLITSVFCMPMVTFLPVLVRDAFHLADPHLAGRSRCSASGGFSAPPLSYPSRPVGSGRFVELRRPHPRLVHRGDGVLSGVRHRNRAPLRRRRCDGRQQHGGELDPAELDRRPDPGAHLQPLHAGAARRRASWQPGDRNRRLPLGGSQSDAGKRTPRRSLPCGADGPRTPSDQSRVGRGSLKRLKLTGEDRRVRARRRRRLHARAPMRRVGSHPAR